MAKSASELYTEMVSAICSGRYLRRSEDKDSPMQQDVMEAEFGCRFVLEPSADNVPRQRSIKMEQAVALTLHFFADTEDGRDLRRYCKGANRWLTEEGQWVGAYGKIAMPQIIQCVERLRVSPHSRRAIVSMGKMYPMDQHRPACWNMLHFLIQDDALCMSVQQRSLNVPGVMPYDCVVLTNIHNYVAWALGTHVGKLVWNVGSLHMPLVGTGVREGSEGWSCVLPPEVLDNTATCMTWLTDPALATAPWSEFLIGGCET